MFEVSLPETNAALAGKMREKLGLGGEDRLEVKLRRGRRILPRAVKKDVKYLVDMEKICLHPKLAPQVDPQKTQRAEDNLRRYLDSVNVRDRRIGQVLGIVAPLAFNILVIFAAVVTWLVWRGRL
ncbi:hypothetical protein [Tropicimonas isoalkanivorans]|uniref:Uncharacterized protein n=1 Tax=Tropicimonas isoalkanivorans TaxID=441112 RepID=A0A1I1IP55_9RHOB|nr:hypothetical protein [Tropicimonas isoalkanivorans]SFC35543.1 hypothetical protein SAMN04488094_10488 [Tropicimonas isoalkanivorans]